MSRVVHSQSIRITLVNPRLREEICRRIRKRAPRQNLSRKSDTSNLRPPQIHPTKTIPIIRSPGNLILNLNRMHHHGQRPRSLLLRHRAQAFNHLPRILQPILAHEEPGRFGREENDRHERDGPDPLDGEGNAVAPLGRVVEEALQHAGGDELADGPAEVHVDG